MKLLKDLEKKEHFSVAEQAIIDYIFEQRDGIADLTAKELGEKTFTSPATVVRLCKKLGLKGYPEFKLKLLSELKVTPENINFRHNPITNDDSIKSVIDKIAALEIEAIEETKSEFDTAAMLRVVDIIEKSTQVDFYAYDNNLRMAQYGSYHFMHAGKLSSVNSATNAQYVQALASPPNHAAILISRTGANKKLIEIARILRKNRVKIIVLTDSSSKPLVKLADEFIYVANTDKFVDLGTILFPQAVKYVLDVLFGILFADNYENTLDANAHYERVGEVQIWSGNHLHNGKK